MKKASEYQSHADECRRLASQMEEPSQRDQLLEMAAHWEKLASDRTALITIHPELAVDGEHDEEPAGERALRTSGLEGERAERR